MWKRLDIDDLRKILSEDETQKLNNLSLNEDMTDVINNCIDMVSDTWRGVFLAKGYALDVRDHYTPPEYSYYILVHARHAVWTRFPNSSEYALDDARNDEYKEALEILKNPFIGTSAPDYSTDPELSGTTLSSSDACITVPLQRFPSIGNMYGYWAPYASNIKPWEI